MPHKEFRKSITHDGKRYHFEAIISDDDINQELLAYGAVQVKNGMGTRLPKDCLKSR